MGMGGPLAQLQDGRQGIIFLLTLVFGSGMKMESKYPNRMYLITFEGAISTLLNLNLRDMRLEQPEWQ